MRLLAFLLLALAPVACGGVQSAADKDWTPEPPAKDKRFRETEALYGAAQPLDLNEPRQSALLGVRHDLMLSNGAHEAPCACLAVEVGSASDANKFFWLGGPPETARDAIVVAVGARGVACPNGPSDDRRRRPSISAVDQENDDVIVEVEDLPEGRPLASGAVIPRPGPKGSIYIRPRKGNGIYGHSPGVGRCKVR